MCSERIGTSRACASVRAAALNSLAWKSSRKRLHYLPRCRRRPATARWRRLQTAARRRRGSLPATAAVPVAQLGHTRGVAWRCLCGWNRAPWPWRYDGRVDGGAAGQQRRVPELGWGVKTEEKRNLGFGKLTGMTVLCATATIVAVNQNWMVQIQKIQSRLAGYEAYREYAAHAQDAGPNI